MLSKSLRHQRLCSPQTPGAGTAADTKKACPQAIVEQLEPRLLLSVTTEAPPIELMSYGTDSSYAILVEDFQSGWANGNEGSLDSADTPMVNGWAGRGQGSWHYETDTALRGGHVVQHLYNWNWNAWGKAHGADLSGSDPVVLRGDAWFDGARANTCAVTGLANADTQGYYLKAALTTSTDVIDVSLVRVDGISAFGTTPRSMSGLNTLASFTIDGLDAVTMDAWHSYFLKIIPDTNTIEVWSDLSGSENAPLLSVTDTTYDLADLTHVAFSSGGGETVPVSIDNIAPHAATGSA